MWEMEALHQRLLTVRSHFQGRIGLIWGNSAHYLLIFRQPLANRAIRDLLLLRRLVKPKEK